MIYSSRTQPEVNESHIHEMPKNNGLIFHIFQNCGAFRTFYKEARDLFWMSQKRRKLTKSRSVSRGQKLGKQTSSQLEFQNVILVFSICFKFYLYLVFNF